MVTDPRARGRLRLRLCVELVRGYAPRGSSHPALYLSVIVKKSLMGVVVQLGPSAMRNWCASGVWQRVLACAGAAVSGETKWYIMMEERGMQ